MQVLSTILGYLLLASLTSSVIGFIALNFVSKRKVQRTGSRFERARDFGKVGFGHAAAGILESAGTRSGSIFTYMFAGGGVAAAALGIVLWRVDKHSGALKRDTEARHQQAMSLVVHTREVLEAHRKRTGSYPTDGALAEAFTAAGEALPDDPWGHPLHYELVAPTRPRGYFLRSLGADGVDGTADDLGDRIDR